jgi:hypothetical protein
MARGALLAIALTASACPHREAAREPAPQSTARDDAAHPSSSPKPGSSQPLALQLVPQLQAEGIGLSLQAHASSVELADTILVARGNDAPDPNAPAALRLRLDCHTASTPSGCITLSAGSELLAPSWLARPEAERCDALYRPPAPGDYRLIARSCDGQKSVEARVHWSGP